LWKSIKIHECSFCCMKEKLKVSLMLHAVPSSCAPKVSDNGRISETKQQFLWECHQANRRPLCVVELSLSICNSFCFCHSPYTHRLLLVWHHFRETADCLPWSLWCHVVRYVHIHMHLRYETWIKLSEFISHMVKTASS
jgi:hypothetical protein